MAPETTATHRTEQQTERFRCTLRIDHEVCEGGGWSSAEEIVLTWNEYRQLKETIAELRRRE
jgi:hypothetical protein